MSPTRPAWSNQTKFIVILVLLVVLAYLLRQFGAIITPIILALVLSYILTPAVNRIQRGLRTRRSIAILLVYLMVVLIIGAGVVIVTPMLARQGRDIGYSISELIRQANTLLGVQFNLVGVSLDGRILLNELNGSIQSFLQPLVTGTFDILRVIIASLAWVVFIFVISFYLIRDTASLRAWIENLVPPPYRTDFTEIRDEIGMIWSAFFRGQLVLALIVATIITTVYFAVGLHFALLMGVIAGLLEFLPSIGHGIWLCIALPLAFFRGSHWLPIPGWGFALVVLGMHILFEQFDANYLIPRIIGRSVRLPPLVIILGIVAGATLAGVLGVMLAAPTIASLRVIGRYIYGQVVNAEPFPNDIAAPLPPPDPFWWRHPGDKTRPEVEQEKHGSAE